MITILDNFPVILTKDRAFYDRMDGRARAGQVIILPEDAILIDMPTITNITT